MDLFIFEHPWNKTLTLQTASEMNFHNFSTFLTISVAFIFGTFSASAQTDYRVTCIGFYNLENLFDTLDTPGKNDSEFLPNGSNQYTGFVYKDKLKNLSRVISELGTEMTPDGVAILGVAEIENRSVLEDLAAQAPLKNRNYKIVHEESPDSRGVDVAMLYNPKYFRELSHRVIPVLLDDDKGGSYYSRDILHVTGILGGIDTLHVFVNHWPSRRGGTSSIAKRNYAASLCKKAVDSLTALNPNVKIFITGDLNDDPVNESVKDILNAKGKIKEVKTGGLYNPMWDKYKTGDGTLTYNDSWNLFDQTIFSSAFLNKNQKGYFFHSAVVYRKPYLLNKDGRFKGSPFRTYSFGSYIGGFSDHLPVYSFFLQKIVK
jgi:hypothetical protein